jgi:hypothetical protein
VALPPDAPRIALPLLSTGQRAAAAPIARQISPLFRHGAERDGGASHRRGHAVIDRRLFFNVDWVLAITALALGAIGVAMIYSATPAGRHADLSVKQLYFVVIGVVAMFLCLLVDYRRLVDRAFLSISGRGCARLHLSSAPGSRAPGGG